MGTITAGSIIDRSAILLQDVPNVRWPRAELLGWLNEGQRAIVSVKPSAYPVTASLSLVSGTKQSLPTAAVALLDVTRNLPGRAVRLIPREILDSFRPGWHSDTATAEVTNYLYDPNTPRQFYVYPPNSGAGSVEVVYAAAPPVISSEGAAIALADVYDSALVNYVVYRAYAKDTDYSSSDANAKAYYEMFKEAVAGRVGAEAGTGPHLAMAPAGSNPASTK